MSNTSTSSKATTYQPSQSPSHGRKDPNRPRKTGTIIMIAVIALLCLGAIWYYNHRNAPPETAQGGRGGGGGGGGRRGGGFGNFNTPLPVATVDVTKGDINIYLQALGAIAPLRTVTVRTQINGQLLKIGFQEGQMVKAGDELAVIDPRPYEAQLLQAEGNLAQAQAQLQTAKNDLQRYEKLSTEDSISKMQVDTSRSQVAQYEGLLKSDEAAIATVKLNLTYCHIKAPVDGRVGLRLVDVGNYVTTGDSGGLVVLTQVNPISAIFTLPEDNVGRIAARMASGAKLPVDAYDRGQNNKVASGTLATVDNQIDASTGTFKLRAEFANDDNRLFPNQFVNIRLLVDTVHDTLFLPTSSIERGQNGTFVYVVAPDTTVAATNITLGAVEGEKVAVTSGLNVGDKVVIDGADKLRDGMKVYLTGPGYDPAAEAAKAQKAGGGRGGRGGGNGDFKGKGKGGGRGGKRGDGSDGKAPEGGSDNK